ncbi:hypothetical protein [Streptosporangium sp. NPDC002524]|uniref:hypothetical protein n=1 Tax=Streptosporangium sp. NPDC002524 TaxID=3154537 RepID=UPI003325634F
MRARGGERNGQGRSARSSEFEKQAKRHARPLVLIGTAAEVIAAASTLTSKLPDWVASAIIVGIPLATFGLYQWRRARFLDDQVKQLYYFDRKYVRSLSRWTMRESEVDGYLNGTHHGEREMIALAPIRQWTWSIMRRAEGDLPFYDHPPVLRNQQASRSGAGVCIFRQPHKQGTSLSFRIEFDPMLRPGERVNISFDIDVPVYKPATLEGVRMRPSPRVATPGEAEFSSTYIEYPVDELVKEIVIPERLRTYRHGIQVIRLDNEFAEEANFVSNNECFHIDRSTIDNQAVWILRLERYRPPLNTLYRIYWEPPKESQL